MTIDIILIILFTLAWNEYDFILTQKRFSIMNLFLSEGSKAYEWYFTNDYKTKSWIKKNMLVFLLDGAHLNSSIWRSIAYYWVSLTIYQDWRVYALTVALYTVTGTIHSFWNGTLIKFNKKTEI